MELLNFTTLTNAASRPRTLIASRYAELEGDDDWRVESDGVGELIVFCPEY